METVSIDGRSGSVRDESVRGREAIGRRAAEETGKIGNEILVAVGKPTSGGKIQRLLVLLLLVVGVVLIKK